MDTEQEQRWDKFSTELVALGDLSERLVDVAGDLLGTAEAMRAAAGDLAQAAKGMRAATDAVLLAAASVAAAELGDKLPAPPNRREV